MQMEIKHISLGINNKTHNVNNETSNDESTPFNNAPAYMCVRTYCYKIATSSGIHEIKEKEKE